MSTQINNVKIALRYDTLENWMQANPLLLQGEYTTVILPDSSIRIKIGDGVHTFNELPFIGSCVSVISGDVPFSNDLSVVKLTNEEYNKLIAEEKINPATLYVITDNYTSMRGAQLKDLGQPTDDNDAATKYYVDSSISGIQLPDLTPYVKKVDVNLSYVKNDKKIYLSADNHVTYIDTQDFIKDGMLSSAELCGNILVLKFNTDAGTTPISVNLSSFANVYSAGYGLNLINGQFSVDTSKIAEITDLTAYETKADLTANYYKKNQTSSNVELNNKFNNIYTKSETSSAIELRNRFDNIVKVGSYLDSTGYSLSSSDLSVVGISEEDYLKLVADGIQNDKVLYIVSSDNLNARNERIINVAEPSISSDAATKYYVDSSISSFTPPTYTAGYGLNLNDYQFNIDTSKIAEVSDLIIYEQISNKVSSISEYSTDIQYPTAKVVWDISDYIDGFEKAVYGQDKDRKFTEIPYIDINAISDTGLLYQQVNFVLEQINYEPLLDENSSYQDVINAVQAIYEDQGEVCPELTDMQAVVDAINAIATESPNMLAAPSGNSRMLFGGSAGTSKSMKQFVLGLKDKISQNKKQIASNLSNITDLSTYAHNLGTFAYNHVAMVNNNGQIYSNSLSVYKVTRQKYIDLVNDGKESESAVYVITDPGINAYNQRISCVADPVDVTDAVNKRYVDGVKNVVDSKHLNDYAETDVIAEDENGNEFTFTIFTKGLNY